VSSRLASSTDSPARFGTLTSRAWLATTHPGEKEHAEGPREQTGEQKKPAGTPHPCAHRGSLAKKGTLPRQWCAAGALTS
jgi:hypothetical protein